MSGPLSVFDAAREMPDAIAFIDGSQAVTFGEAARRTGPLCAALLAARPQALALTAKADAQSLLWLYAAFASGTPLLLLHERETETERARLKSLVCAAEPPTVDPDGLLTTALPSVSESAALVFISTSGSTGTPRLVELSRAAALASAQASAQNLGWRDDDRWLLCLPLAHTGGLSVVIRCLIARRTVVLFDAGPSGVLSEVERLAQLARTVTLISLVPTVLSRLLAAGVTPAPSLRAVLVGGAGCSPALVRCAQQLQWPLLTSYGLTETASQVVTRRYAERLTALPERDGCVSSGHPLPGVQLRFRDGLIAVRSPTLLTRYVGESSPLDSDGWLQTNDRGELGPDGELYVRGRGDDVIVTAGENVDPSEVEAALLALSGVHAACVVGTPSAEYGYVVSALLVSADRSLAQPARLSELLTGRLARHKQPRRIALVDALPLTRSGKVDRGACAVLLRSSTKLR